MSSNAEDVIVKIQSPEAVVLETYQTEKDNLKKIALTQEHLSQVKNNLSDIIDILSKDKSLFTKASDYWGDLSVWQKIIGGFILTVPTLAAGIATHLGILLAISGTTVVVYASGSIILDDHNHYNKNVAANLKEGICSLADILSITISALDKIREDLSIEIERFKFQNETLAKNIARLSEQIESLSNQVEVFTATEKLLKETQIKLEQEAEKLKQTATTSEELLKKNEYELTQVRKEYVQSQQQLQEKVLELTGVKTSLESEVKKAKNIASTLQTTVKTLSGAVIKDGNQREVFQKKISEVIDSGEQSFLVINEKVQALEKELREVKEQLEKSNNRYCELLDRQESQVERLEKMGFTDIQLKQAQELDKLTKKNAAMKLVEKAEHGIHVHGLYAQHKIKALPPEEVSLTRCITVK